MKDKTHVAESIIDKCRFIYGDYIGVHGKVSKEGKAMIENAYHKMITGKRNRLQAMEYLQMGKPR